MNRELRSEEFLQESMRKFGETVYALALSQVRRSADAEDICQDVFLRLLQDRTVFRNDEHLKAWLLRVTLNRCRDFFRLAYNSRREPLEDGDAQESAAGENGAEPEDDVWASVGELPPKLRSAVHLYYGEGYSCKEIARIQGCTCAAAHTRLHQARIKLKLKLCGESGEAKAEA